MLKDYYAILEININATNEEIKIAFKKQALKWHPDRNHGIDTNEKMQEINEAKLILLDVDARERYNNEYAHFKKYEKQFSTEYKEPVYENTDYKIQDDILYKWIKNAQRQAIELGKQTIKDFKGMAKVGLQAGVKATGNAIIGQVIIGVVILFVIAMSKGCK